MPIRFQCDCGHVWTVPDGSAGQFGWCRHCRTIIRVPGRRSGRSEDAAGGTTAATRLPGSGVIRLLLVDPEPDCAAAARQANAGSGLEVEVTGSRDEAAEVLKRFVPDMAIVSADLPEGMGFKACADLNRALAPSGRGDCIRLAMVATDWDKNMIKRARQAGAQAFLNRQALLKDLAGWARRLAAQKP